MSTVPQQGNESRTSMLPSSMPSGIGFLGSSYSPIDSLKTPGQIGVKVGNSMGDVINAVKGVAFYTDTIGFGESSSGLTRGMPLAPLGINYFLNTGQKCSNGATMYNYFEGIPRGDALGTRVQGAMKEMGLPGLRGLAPGMIEDAKSALNPGPMLNALLGSGYPQCKQVTRQVGDMYGKIRDPSTGEPWIESPETAFAGKDGLMYQTRWVQDTDTRGNPINLTKEQWAKQPKSFNPDGTPIKRKEGFDDFMNRPATVATIGILCLLMFGAMTMKKK
jgi:hypothetical protein